MPRSWPQPLTSRPSTVTFPPDAVSSPMAMRSAVVLPQPEGPMSATISPSCTLKLTRLSACTLHRLRPDIGVDHLGEIAGLGDLAEFDHLPLHPGKLAHGQRQLRRDRANLHGVIEDEGGAG